MNKKDKDVAVPGEQLGVEEEYMPGSGVYLEDGKLYSSALGALDIDTKSRKIGVKARSRVAVPEAGDIVEGVVISPLKEDSALIKIIAIKGKKILSGTFTGILHVSQAAKSYTDTIFDVLNLNDRILAKVITSWTPHQLSTAEDDLGVIYATCTKCGNELVLKRGRLFCNRDKIFERKKVSSFYLLKEE
jgi:exosome complex component CSL4